MLACILCGEYREDIEKHKCRRINTMEYTKGEWKAQQPDFGDARIDAWISIQSTDGLEVAIVTGEHSITEEDYANAHLIAATPAMYETLKALLKIVKGDGNRPHHNACYGVIDPHPDCALCKSITIEELGYKALALAEGRG